MLIHYFGDDPATFITRVLFSTETRLHFSKCNIKELMYWCILIFVNIASSHLKERFSDLSTVHITCVFLFRTKFISQLNCFGMYWLKSLSVLPRVSSKIWIISSIFLNPQYASLNLPCRKGTNGRIGFVVVSYKQNWWHLKSLVSLFSITSVFLSQPQS